MKRAPSPARIAQGRQLRAGRRRHAVSRRNRRHADGSPDPITPCAAAGRIFHRRRQDTDQDRCPDHRRHQSRFSATGPAGPFREDFFYRLNVVPLRLPPLRERREDIPDLVRHFLRKAEASVGLPLKHLEPAARRRLKLHAWPGNVRELENLIRRLTVLNPDEGITEGAVAAELIAAVLGNPRLYPPLTTINRALPARSNGISAPISPNMAMDCRRLDLYHRILRDVERPLIAISLAALPIGNQMRAAQLLGLNRNTLAQENPRSGHPGLSHQRRLSGACTVKGGKTAARRLLADAGLGLPKTAQ